MYQKWRNDAVVRNGTQQELIASQKSLLLLNCHSFFMIKWKLCSTHSTFQGLSIHSSPPGTEWTKNAWLVEKHDARQHQWIMTLWYTILYIADLLLYYSCMVESKQSFLPERHFNPQPCYFTQSYRCLFQLPKFKSPLGKGKKQEYSERRLLGYFIFKLFLWFKGTLTEFELNILNFIFLFFMYRMILTSIYNASSKFKSQILSYKQETQFEIIFVL